MVVPMLRPTCSARSPRTPATRCSSAATCRTSPTLARKLRDEFDGSSTSSSSACTRPTTSTWSEFGEPLEAYGYAACYSPDPDDPGGRCCPFDARPGRLIDDVWAQWLRLGPGADGAAHADALRSMRRIYLDAGKRDEWYLDLGAQAFAARARASSASSTPSSSSTASTAGSTYRYPGAIRELVLALP